MSHEDVVKNLKVGDIFYECQYGQNIKAQVVTSIIESTNDDGKLQWEWGAINMTTGQPISYFATENLMHYGPRIYDEPEYFNIKTVDGQVMVEVEFV